MKNLKLKITLCALVSSLACANTPSFAHTTRTLAQQCELGQSCPIPGNDGGQTSFKVTPATGTLYMCKVTSKSQSLKFSLTGGKNFSITKGKGLYNANPNASIEISGRFSHPEDMNDQGEIRLTKLPFSSEGSVTCYQKV